jgi:serine/threonine protein kinase
MSLPEDAPVRTAFGPYRVLRELGRGATGVVFLAERSDDEFHRPVALKVLRFATWDRRSQDLLTSERRMLSQLQHPNIAALLDWGTTDDGAQWMATEYVEGEPIDVWCRARPLDVPGILDVFEQVCRAVEYASPSRLTRYPRPPRPNAASPPPMRARSRSLASP